MKKIQYFLLLALGVSACQTEIDNPRDARAPEKESPVLHATLEGTAADAKTYADADLHVLWNNDDRVSFFDKNTRNKEYRFTGPDGANAGDLELVTSGPGAVTEIDHYYAVYPYSATNAYEFDNILCATLPQVQTYAPDSFGPGANLMVAVSNNYDLAFKNVGGYLCLKLYGSGISVHSITLRSNDADPLAGPVRITPTLGGVPSMAFDLTDPSALSNTLTLEAPTPVALGADAEHSTAFWMVVPPMTMAHGFTVTVVDSNGKVYEKSTAKSVTFPRGTLQSMKAFDVADGKLEFGVYLAAQEPALYNKVTDRMSIYEMGTQAWFRFLHVPTFTVRELGPIPMPIAQGDSFEASLQSTVAGVLQDDKVNYTLTVQSYEGGILNLVSPAGDRFIIRF